VRSNQTVGVKKKEKKEVGWGTGKRHAGENGRERRKWWTWREESVSDHQVLGRGGEWLVKTGDWSPFTGKGKGRRARIFLKGVWGGEKPKRKQGVGHNKGGRVNSKN